MEEMTARREQVVASTLSDYIKDLDVVSQVMDDVAAAVDESARGIGDVAGAVTEMTKPIILIAKELKAIMSVPQVYYNST